jgi:hypothetical protein
MDETRSKIHAIHFASRSLSETTGVLDREALWLFRRAARSISGGKFRVSGDGSLQAICSDAPTLSTVGIHHSKWPSLVACLPSRITGHYFYQYTFLRTALVDFAAYETTRSVNLTSLPDFAAQCGMDTRIPSYRIGIAAHYSEGNVRKGFYGISVETQSIFSDSMYSTIATLSRPLICRAAKSAN